MAAVVGLGVVTVSTAATSGSAPLRARSFAGTPTVGVLFGSRTATVHHCTASVVDSPRGDLVLTAAHCVTGSGIGAWFAPGYHDGVEPYGRWRVTAAYGLTRWTLHHRPQGDVAFLVVAPRVIAGQLRRLQSVTGGNALGSDPSDRTLVTVPAYDAGSNDHPITCTAPVYHLGNFPAFDCTPYVDGTSGAPWLVSGTHGSVVVGLIGGLHQGGCLPSTSYSPAFRAAVAAAWSRAVAGGPPSMFPPAGSDGCTTGL